MVLGEKEGLHVAKHEDLLDVLEPLPDLVRSKENAHVHLIDDALEMGTFPQVASIASELRSFHGDQGRVGDQKQISLTLMRQDFQGYSGRGFIKQSKKPRNYISYVRNGATAHCSEAID
jgi:hypothetical protein